MLVGLPISNFSVISATQPRGQGAALRGDGSGQAKARRPLVLEAPAWEHLSEKWSL